MAVNVVKHASCRHVHLYKIENVTTINDEVMLTEFVTNNKQNSVLKTKCSTKSLAATTASSKFDRGSHLLR